MPKKLIKAIFYIIVSVLIMPQIIFAASDTLPDMLYGEVDMCTLPFSGSDTGCMSELGSKYYYGGQRGNFAVYNPEDGYDYGFLNNIATGAGLADADCSMEELLIQHPASCFSLGLGPTGETSGGSEKLLVSRAILSIADEEVLAYEVPALYFGNILVGDAKIPDYSNFQFWGRHLAQSEGAGAGNASGATWKVPQYLINTDAQAAWDQKQYDKYVAKIQALKGEAKPVDAANSSLYTLDSSIHLQSETSLSGVTPPNDEILKYPEGKLWLAQKSRGASLTRNMRIEGSNTYSGQGTIIVNGDLTLKSGADLKKSDPTASLGIIVLGNVYFEGLNQFDGAIFAIDDPSDTDITGHYYFNGDNILLTGSFVGTDFSNYASHSSIQIRYDYNLDRSWPPGFRYLDMPHPKTAGNADD